MYKNILIKFFKCDEVQIFRNKSGNQKYIQEGIKNRYKIRGLLASTHQCTSFYLPVCYIKCEDDFFLIHPVVVYQIQN